jgi:hypothetical protein
MRQICIIIFISFLSHFAFAQDIITLKNGVNLKTKVLQVNDKKVLYTKYEESNGKIYSIAYSKIFIIIFEKKNAQYQHNRKVDLDSASKQ